MVDNGGSVRRSGRRWLWIIAGIAGAGAVLAVVAIWHLPARMYPNAGDAEARAALQGGLLTAAAALTAVAGALIALDETRQANAETRRANRDTHVRELYVEAVKLLNDTEQGIRLAGIYALERIAMDSPADHRTVVEVLSAFIRSQTASVSTVRRPPADYIFPTPTTDVQAALTVLGRIPTRPGVPRADLTNARITGAFLSGANFAGARLIGTNLGGVWLDEANLTGAQLFEADLTRAWLGSAKIADAQLWHVDLSQTLALSQDQVDTAQGDTRTRLPAGLTRPDSWGQEEPPLPGP